MAVGVGGVGGVGGVWLGVVVGEAGGETGETGRRHTFLFGCTQRARFCLVRLLAS